MTAVLSGLEGPNSQASAWLSASPEGLDKGSEESSSPDLGRFTDAGNALMLAAARGNDLRYTPEKGFLIKGDQVFDLKGKVMVFNGGSGSTVGSYNIYNMKIYDSAPAAMIMKEADAIITIGCIMADIPLVHRLDESVMDLIETGMKVEVNSEAGKVRLHRRGSPEA